MGDELPKTSGDAPGNEPALSANQAEIRRILRRKQRAFEILVGGAVLFALGVLWAILRS